eukprot:GHVP01037682.1.p1 GENE.GHVP01037682.1~~GHVP01037682.1.p1  ORF type:complete len:599 (+),score=106.85 GHVP01037682.1:2-1798(+)
MMARIRKKMAGTVLIEKTGPRKTQVSIKLESLEFEFGCLRELDEVLAITNSRIATSWKKKKNKARKISSATTSQSDLSSATPTPSDLPSVIWQKKNDNGTTTAAESMKIADIINKRFESLEIEGECFEIFFDVPIVQELFFKTRAIARCPLVPSVEFNCAREDKFSFIWEITSPQGLISKHEGNLYLLKDADVGCTISLTVSPKFYLHSNIAHRVSKTCTTNVIPCPTPYWNSSRFSKFTKQENLNSGLRCMTFNILASTYANADFKASKDGQALSMYPYIEEQHMKNEYRYPLTLFEILQVNPDVFALQECDTDFFKSCLVPFGSHFGYEIRYKEKSETAREGSAWGIRKDALVVEDEMSMKFRDYIKEVHEEDFSIKEVDRRTLLSKIPEFFKFFENALPKINTIFHGLLLRHRKSGMRFFVCNTHFYWHPNAAHIRTLQFASLINWIQYRTASFDAKTILFGDFNSTPPSGSRQLMDHWKISAGNQDCWKYLKIFDIERERENYLTENITSQCQGIDIELSPPQLRNCFKEIKESSFSTCTAKFRDFLDYIFCDPSIRIVREMDVPNYQDLEPYNGLPNETYPSDHISLAVDLEF